MRERTAASMTASVGTGMTDSRSRATSPNRKGDGIRVLIVSDVLLHRDALAALLRHVDGATIVGAVADAHEAAGIVGDGLADVVLLDDADGNIEGARSILGAAPDARVVVLGTPERVEDVIALAEAGVLGYVTREQSLSELGPTIETVARDELACPPWIASLLVRRVQALAAHRPGPVDVLTPREAGILDLIAEGLSNREIASRLHIELTTVKNHVHNILEKLGASTRAEAVALAAGRSVVRGRSA
jgi:two-component system, NarL family, nitrate/nitrite response regulator NarL